MKCTKCGNEVPGKLYWGYDEDDEFVIVGCDECITETGPGEFPFMYAPDREEESK